MTSEISVIRGEMDSIITRVPISVATDVMICVMLWFRVIPRVSMSFVIRERTSP